MQPARPSAGPRQPSRVGLRSRPPACLRFPCLSFICLSLLLPTVAPAQSSISQEALLRGTAEYTIRDCRTQLENEQYDACQNLLKGLMAQINVTEHPELKDLADLLLLRSKLVDAHRKAQGLRTDHPDQSAKILFAAYTALPERYFPYDEVTPLWNLYLREESGRSRFARYRNLKLLVKGPKDDPSLEESFSRAIQQRLLDYGFVYTDPTASKTPDVLLKVALKLFAPDAIADPRAQFSRAQKLAVEFQSFKWVLSEVSVKQPALELETAAVSDEEARTQVVTKGAERTADLLFYHTLRQLFPPDETRSRAGNADIPSNTPTMPQNRGGQ